MTDLERFEEDVNNVFSNTKVLPTVNIYITYGEERQVSCCAVGAALGVWKRDYRDDALLAYIDINWSLKYPSLTEDDRRAIEAGFDGRTNDSPNADAAYQTGTRLREKWICNKH